MKHQDKQDRLKFEFEVTEKDKASECYDYFTYRNSKRREEEQDSNFDIKESMKIYL